MRASHPLIYVVILNWNQSDDTLNCLDAVFQSVYPRLGVVVVDNHSDDNSVAKIQV